MSEAPSVPAPRRPAAHFGDPPQVAAPVLVLLINAAVGLATAVALIAIHLLELL